MNCRTLVLLTLVLLLVCEIIFVIAQRRSDSRKDSRKKDRKKAKDKARGRGRGGRGGSRTASRAQDFAEEDKFLFCHSCEIDWSAPIEENGLLCYNPIGNLTLSDDNILTRCPKETKWCEVEFTKDNGVLVKIDRYCGGPSCVPYCLSKGYGIERETCISCCPGKTPETVLDLEYTDDEERPVYKCLETSSIKIMKKISSLFAFASILFALPK